MYMKNTIRNTFIINHAFRRFLVASVLTSVIVQLNILVDGIIVSQTVSADAISVVSMSMPILSLVTLVTSMICVGSSLMMANEIGNQNYKQVDRLFTMCLSSIFVVSLILAIVLCSFTNVISHLLTSEERFLPLLNSYLPISFIGSIIFALLFALAQFIKISGQPGLATRCMIVGTLGNIVLDLLFVVLFDMGMQGAALASAVSSLLSVLVFIPYLRSEHKPFRLVSPKGGWYGALLGNSLVRGLPTAVGAVVIALLIMSLNAIVLKSQGANGLFILSVCMQMLMVSLLVMGGAGSALIGIGGVLLGEQDYQGLHLLVNNIFKIIGGSMVVISAIAIAFPTLLARLFGASGELLLASEEPLRIFCLIFIPFGLIIPLSNLFMVLNRNTLSTMLAVGIIVCILPLMWLASLFAPEYLWYSMPVGMWLLLFITMLTTWFISRRTKGLHWFYLTRMHSDYHWVTYSVNYDMEDVGVKLNNLLEFIDTFKLPRKLHVSVHHCLEELMCNEVEMARFTQKEGTFDIIVNNQKDKISMIVKDVGKPYNPVIKYLPDNLEDITQSQLSMMLVNRFCQDVNYKYMNGVNYLYLNFEKEKI